MTEGKTGVGRRTRWSGGTRWTPGGGDPSTTTRASSSRSRCSTTFHTTGCSFVTIREWLTRRWVPPAVVATRVSRRGWRRRGCSRDDAGMITRWTGSSNARSRCGIRSSLALSRPSATKTKVFFHSVSPSRRWRIGGSEARAIGTRGSCPPVPWRCSRRCTRDGRGTGSSPRISIRFRTFAYRCVLFFVLAFFIWFSSFVWFSSFGFLCLAFFVWFFLVG